MIRRLAFVRNRLARRGLFAAGISVLAIVAMIALEGVALRWMGFSLTGDPDRYSVVEFRTPCGEGAAMSVFWRRRTQSDGGLEHYLQLHSWPLGQESTCFRWDHITPRSAIWTDDQGSLAIGSLEGTIYTWDSTRPQSKPRALGEHPGCAMLFATLDGRWLVAANDWLLGVWDLQTRQQLWRRNDLTTNSLTVHAPTSRIVCGTAAGEVLELDLTTGRTERVVARHEAGVDCVAVSPDGSRVATIGLDRRLMVTNWQTAETVWTQQHGPNGEVCFSPAGDTLVSSGYMNYEWSLLTWDAQTGQQQNRLKGHTKVVLGLTFTSESTLYSWGADGAIRVWDLTQSTEIDAYQPDPPC